MMRGMGTFALEMSSSTPSPCTAAVAAAVPVAEAVGSPFNSMVL